MGVLNNLHCQNKVCEDNSNIHACIKLAWKWIFEDGIPLTSEAHPWSYVSDTYTGKFCNILICHLASFTHAWIKCILCQAPWWLWIQLLLNLCTQSHAWVWAQSLEVNPDASGVSSSPTWGWQGSKIQWKVCVYLLVHIVRPLIFPAIYYHY